MFIIQTLTKNFIIECFLSLKRKSREYVREKKSIDFTDQRRLIFQVNKGDI